MSVNFIANDFCACGAELTSWLAVQDEQCDGCTLREEEEFEAQQEQTAIDNNWSDKSDD
jgi:hypothetical protein